MEQKDWFKPPHKIAPLPRKLAKLPKNPEEGASKGRFPSWLHRRIPQGVQLTETQQILEKHRLNTVCEEAKCPNRLECHSKKTATFLALGKECTRNCGFCDIDFSKTPLPLEEDEPLRIAKAVSDLGLKHVVITMVARDDLEDGGATQIAKIVQEIRLYSPKTQIELLTSDFAGNTKSLDTILAIKPDVFNHNLETVRSLTPRVRHKATYDRSLSVLRYIKENSQGIWIKSGLMLGLGETQEETHQAIEDLKNVGCDMITIGQYLQADPKKLLVKSFITPEEFKAYEMYGLSIGVKFMVCGPFVRSSYHAGEIGPFQGNIL